MNGRHPRDINSVSSPRPAGAHRRPAKERPCAKLLHCHREISYARMGFVRYDETMAQLARSGVSPSLIDQLRTACTRAGLSFDQLDASVVERMVLLAERTPTFDDTRRAMDLAEMVFDYYEHGSHPFDPVEKTIVRVGSLFSDIGKTGPAGASPDEQRLIADMFSVEGVPDENMPVREFFEGYFPQDATLRTQRFLSLGLDPSMTMRTFWNHHSGWTLNIIQHNGVPAEAVPAAATHHLLENINPDAIVADDGKFTRHFGVNAAFDRPEKLVILLDKYDAARRRGRKDHSSAISWLRELITRNARFAKDAQFEELIQALDQVMRSRDFAHYAPQQRSSTPAARGR